MKPFRLRRVSLPVLLGLVFLFGAASVCHADALDPDQIKAILHTATVEEEGFIDRTIAMVNQGTLPMDLFQSCFIWARKKPKHQFQYFKHALLARAADAGIAIP